MSDDTTQPVPETPAEAPEAPAKVPEAAPAKAPETPVQEPVECVAVAMDPQEIEKGKLFAILGYIISIFCIIPLIQKDNEFALFHAKQVLLLLLTGIALSFLNIIPCLGQIVFAIGSLALLVLDIIGLINAIKGEAKPVPLIGKYAVEWFKGVQKNG